MQKHLKPVFLMSALLVLGTACGKNMGTRVQNQAGNGNQAPATAAAKVNGVKDGVLTATDKLLPLDEAEVTAAGLELPFALGVNELGADDKISPVKKAPYSKDGNLGAQVTLRLPKDGAGILKIKKMTLTLQHVTLFDAKGDAKNLDGQLLCVLSSQECSGTLGEDRSSLNDKFFADKVESQIKSDLFSATAVKAVDKLATGESVAAVGDKLEIDLVKLFKLENNEDAMKKWLYAATSAIEGKDNFRVLHLSFGPNVYVQSGDVLITAEVKEADLPANYSKENLNTATDKVIAKTGKTDDKDDASGQDDGQDGDDEGKDGQDGDDEGKDGQDT